MKYASVIAAVGLMLTGAAEAADKKVIVWVPNGASDFWKLAEAGMHKAQKELPNFDLQWKYPERADAAIQQRLMEDLVAAGAAAVAVSPLNPKTQVEAFNKIGSQVPLFTFDSDAADVQARLLYRLVQHRPWQKCRRGRRQGHAERRQVHGLRRQHRGRQRP